MGKRFVIDIDNTLLFSHAISCTACGRMKYEIYKVNNVMTDRIKELRKEGAIIILWTGRGWDYYEQTIKQLVDAGVEYDQLIMGKPLGQYIDTEAVGSL